MRELERKTFCVERTCLSPRPLGYVALPNPGLNVISRLNSSFWAQGTHETLSNIY